jgi:tetratricopeptide (TPR) repeat protein
MRLRISIPVLALNLFLLHVSFFAAPGAQASSAREQRILQIQQLIEQNNLVEAKRLLADSAKQFPNDAGFDNLSGIIEAQQNDYQVAETSFKLAIQREPKFTGAYLNLGRLYQENSTKDSHAHEKALEIYERVIKYEPENTEANYQSAALLLEQGRYQDSLLHLSHLPEDTQKSAQALSLKCGDYAAIEDRKHADDAADLLLRSLEFSEPDAQQILLALQKGKRTDLIISLLENLRNRQALSTVSLHRLGLAYEVEGKLTEARVALEQYVESGNLSVATLFELARVAHEQKDYKGSLGYLAHAQDIEPQNPAIHYSFGLVCLDLDLIAEARNSFEKALQLKPDEPSYNYAMGAASLFRHDPVDAVPYFEKYVKLKPRDPRGPIGIATAFFRAKDYVSALPWIKQAAQNPETSTVAHYYLGSIALQESRLEDAANELQFALKANPDYADALAGLGQYYLQKKDYAQAERQLQHALQVDADHSAANFYLLMLYTRTGDSRREAQSKRYDELQKLREEKTQEFLRTVEVRPFEGP